MDDRPIGIFDSGLGGLTIVRALVDLLPAEQLVYFGDTGRFPYGSRDPTELRSFAAEIVDVLVARDVKLVVVACNSAAAAALEHLQARFTVPIVGVIDPGVRAALQVTAGHVGVIGTEATIGSDAYQRALAATGADVRLTTLACPGFVELVEAGDIESTSAYGLVAHTLAPLRVAGVDTLILGCTHYPLLARVIGDVMGREVVLVSSAEETAFDVAAMLRRTGSGRPPARPRRHHTFLTSGDEATFTTLGVRFLGPALGPVAPWRWPEPAAPRR